MLILGACSGELGTDPGTNPAAPVAGWHPVECMPRAEVEAALGEPIGPEEARDFTPENNCGLQAGWVGDAPGVRGMVTVTYGWGSIDYADGLAVGWAEADPATAAACQLDIDTHPTRAEVVAVLGEPVDVDHDEGNPGDPDIGLPELPATERLTWADGDTITFEDDRAQSWVLDDPQVC